MADYTMMHEPSYHQRMQFEIPYIVDGHTKRLVCVYFIKSENGLVKIGRGPAQDRFRAIQGMSPVPLKLLGYFFGAELEMETKVHHYFCEKRKHGEWFDFSEQDINELPRMFPQGVWYFKANP